MESPSWTELGMNELEGQRRLKWYGHVLRRENECVGKRVMGMEVPGKEGAEDQSGSG